MKTKKLTVERVETVAFDNQQLHCSGDANAVIELRDDHGTVRPGDKIVITLESAKKKAEK